MLDLQRCSVPDHNVNLLQPDCSRIATTPIAALASMLEIDLTISCASPYSVITRDGMVTRPPVQSYCSPVQKLNVSYLDLIGVSMFQVLYR